MAKKRKSARPARSKGKSRASKIARRSKKSAPRRKKPARSAKKRPAKKRPAARKPARAPRRAPARRAPVRRVPPQPAAMREPRDSSPIEEHPEERRKREGTQGDSDLHPPAAQWKRESPSLPGNVRVVGTYISNGDVPRREDENEPGRHDRHSPPCAGRVRRCPSRPSASC